MALCDESSSTLAHLLGKILHDFCIINLDFSVWAKVTGELTIHTENGFHKILRINETVEKSGHDQQCYVKDKGNDFFLQKQLEHGDIKIEDICPCDNSKQDKTSTDLSAKSTSIPILSTFKPTSSKPAEDITVENVCTCDVKKELFDIEEVTESDLNNETDFSHENISNVNEISLMTSKVNTTLETSRENSSTETDGRRFRFVCFHCNRCFTSRAALRAHKQNEHDSLNLEKNISGDNQSEQCVTVYQNCLTPVEKKALFRLTQTMTPSNNCLNKRTIAHQVKRDKRIIIREAKQINDKKVTNIEGYSCSLCDYTTFDEEKVIMHMKQGHSNQSIFKCMYCTKTFTSEEDYTSHYLRCTPKHCCKYCTKFFSSRSSLVRHELCNHLNKGKFLCPNYACSKTFQSESDMARHMKRCLKDYPEDIRLPYLCYACNNRFPTQRKFKLHTKQMLCTAKGALF